MEIRTAGDAQLCSASMDFHRGSLPFVPCTPVALTTSPHTLTNSLPRARVSLLRRFIRSTGCHGWTGKLGSLCGLWEFNLHLWCVVFSLRCLEWSLAVLYACLRAVLVCSLCACARLPFCGCTMQQAHIMVDAE